MTKCTLKVLTLMIRPASCTYVCMPVCVYTRCPTILCSQHTEIWAPLCNMCQLSAMSPYLHCNMIWLLSFAMALKQKVTGRHLKMLRLVSSYQLNAHFLYSITIYMLHYNPQHVSSSTLLIFRRTNCIITASGIVTLCRWPYSMPVESGR